MAACLIAASSQLLCTQRTGALSPFSDLQCSDWGFMHMYFLCHKTFPCASVCMLDKYKVTVSELHMVEGGSRTQPLATAHCGCLPASAEPLPRSSHLASLCRHVDGGEAWGKCQ